MATQYTMRALNTTLNRHVYWFSIGSADTAAKYSGYDPAQLTNIVVDYTSTVPDAIGVGNLNLLAGDPGPAGPGFYQGTVSGGSITTGNAILLLNNQIVPFSLSLLASAGGLGGVAISTTGPGSIGNARTQGPDVLIGSLGDGYACAVGCKSDGTLCRVTDASCVTGLNYVGYCDINGKITVAPKKVDKYNVIDFGFIGDAITDNTGNWQILMNNIAPPLTTGGDPASWTAQSKIYFPSGNYFFNLIPGTALEIWRSCYIYGDGIGILQVPNAPATILSFPLGAGGFIIQYAFGHDPIKEIFTANTVIENISILGPGSNGSSSRVTRWLPNTTFTIGDVIVPNYYDTSSNGGLFAYSLLCTGISSDGKTGATEPTWPIPTPPLTDTFTTDNHVTWKTISAHGVELRSGLTKLINCRFAGFAGNGIHALGDVSWATGWQSSLSTITGCESINNGGNGIAIGGGDSNAISCSGNTCRDNYGWNVQDQSFLGCTHIGGHVSGNGAGGWQGKSSTFIQPYSEGGQINVFTDQAKLVGGICEISGDFVPQRTNLTHYDVGNFMRPAADSDFIFYCLTAGTTAASEPDFTIFNGSPMRVGVNSDDSFRSITDGSAAWWCYGVQEISTGLILGSQHGSPGVRPFTVQGNSGAITTTIGVGNMSSSIGDTNELTTMTLSSSDDTNQPTALTLDPTNNRWFWTYTQSSGNRFLEFTRAGATPEGQGQLSAPNGLWTGNRALDPFASSYFGPNKLRLDGDIDLNQDHYLGAKETVRDGYISVDGYSGIVHTFSLPNDSTNGALTELNVKVLAKQMGAGSDCAIFLIRGTWYRKDATIVQVAAPEVVYGEPTDATHCTAGATSWRVSLSLSSTNINVIVSGASSTQIHWYITRVSYEGTRT